MKLKLMVLCPLLSALCISASAQGTAFTYQGRLDNNGSPAPDGLYDFTNALYAVSGGGTAAAVNLAGPLTAVPVTNGLFTVLLDFGNVLNGTPVLAADRRPQQRDRQLRRLESATGTHADAPRHHGRKRGRLGLRQPIDWDVALRAALRRLWGRSEPEQRRQ